MINRRPGHRNGERHPRAKISDASAERLRRLHEEFPADHADHLGYKKLAKMFSLAVSTVQHICTYRSRAKMTPRV